LSSMRKKMSGTMKDLKLPSIGKSKHTSEGSMSSEIFAAATQQQDLMEVMNAGPTPADEEISLADLTTKVFKFVKQGTSADGNVMQKWLCLWLQRALVSDLSELMKKRNSDDECEVQVLANKCFELRISTSEGSDDCWAVILEKFGRCLSLMPCFTAASDKEDEITCKKIVELYSQYHRVYAEVAKAVSTREFVSAAARVRATDDAGLFISVVPMLMELDEAQTVQMAVRFHPIVNEWQVSHLVPSKHFYIDYLIHFLEAHGMEEENLDRYLRLVRLLLEDQPDYNRSALINPDNSMPVRGSLKYPWKHADVLLSLLTSFKDDPDAQMLLMNEFRSIGFWPGVLGLHKMREERSEAVSLALALDDSDVFDALMLDNLDDDLWKASIQCVLSNMDGGDKMDITLQKITETLLSAVGPQKTVEILSEIPGCAEKLPVASLRSIMRVGKLSLVDEKAKVCSFLSTVACYLWQRRSRQSNAQLGTVVAYEADENPEAAATLRSLPFVGTREGHRNVLRPSFDMHHPQQRFYDENEIGHWGVSCTISTDSKSSSATTQHLCAFCSLPLVQVDDSTGRQKSLLSRRLNQHQNITVLPHCGHAYHESCLAGTEGCIICLKNSLSHSITRKRFS